MSTEVDRTLPFMKWHGLGNDFVVVDARARDVVLPGAWVRGIGDRHFGVGFDQLALITLRGDRPHLTFYNSDGSLSAACGNATRCIARYLMDENGADSLTLTTDRGTLQARQEAGGEISVNMGPPQLEWHEVPLAREIDTLHLPIEGDPVATGMGNPHCTFFVADATAVDLPTFGSEIEHHHLYPERTNVQVAQIVGRDHIRMRVWERGVGVTWASGSSSCACAVAAHRRALTGRAVRIDLDGGTLHIDWREDGVWMRGPTTHVFSGTFSREFLESLT